MPKNFIQVSRVDSNAIFGPDLLALIAALRDVTQRLAKVKGIMDCNWTSTDFADLELRFGLAAGQGQVVYGLVRDVKAALDAQTDTQTLITRVG